MNAPLGEEAAVIQCVVSSGAYSQCRYGVHKQTASPLSLVSSSRSAHCGDFSPGSGGWTVTPWTEELDQSVGSSGSDPSPGLLLE